MEPFLSLRHVSKTFHANRALNDISIDFMPGEVHCLAAERLREVDVDQNYLWRLSPG